MQANPRKSKIIALSIALFFCAVALVDTFVSDKFGGRYAAYRFSRLTCPLENDRNIYISVWPGSRGSFPILAHLATKST